MEKLSNAQVLENRRIRISIIVIAVIALLTLFAVSISSISWRTSIKDLYLTALYPIFFISIILIIAKVRIGYFIILLVAINYAILMVQDVGAYFVFKIDNYGLLFVLILPFLLVVSLIPLSTTYLLSGNSQKKKIVLISLAIAFSFPLYAIISKANTNYTQKIHTEYHIAEDKSVTITCKPSFADPRRFVVTSHSKELSGLTEVAHPNSSYQTYSEIKKKYSFRKLRSITLVRIGNEELRQPLTWSATEIKGDITFLEP